MHIRNSSKHPVDFSSASCLFFASHYRKCHRGQSYLAKGRPGCLGTTTKVTTVARKTSVCVGLAAGGVVAREKDFEPRTHPLALALEIVDGLAPKGILRLHLAGESGT